MILYFYKVVFKMSPNFEDKRFRIETIFNIRRGLLCIVPSIRTAASARVKSLVEKSFAVRAPRLFDSIPQKTRSNYLSYEAFKNQFDKFLSKVPDLKSLPNYPQRASSNCLLDQLEQLRRDGIYL